MRIIHGDALTQLRLLDAESIQCCVTSPPYWGLRDYGTRGQIGTERGMLEYVAKLASIFTEVKRVLRNDGTLWLNLGDCYQNKNLAGTPWRVAFALQSCGWYLRSDIIWHKPNPMPEAVTDRPTRSHEYIFMFTKMKTYYYDAKAIRELNSPDMIRRASLGHTRGPNGRVDASRSDGNTLRGEHAKIITANGRNKRTVWTVATRSFHGAHFATFPPKLIEPCILAGSREGDIVLDPFAGSGTTLCVAKKYKRNAIGIELNKDYIVLIKKRLAKEVV